MEIVILKRYQSPLQTSHAEEVTTTVTPLFSHHHVKNDLAGDKIVYLNANLRWHTLCPTYETTDR